MSANTGRRAGPGNAQGPTPGPGGRPGSADPASAPFTGVEDPAGRATVFRCALCGGRFTHGRLVCGTCPLNAGCNLVRCPHCGYGFPRSSRIVGWLRRLFAGGAGGEDAG